MLDIRENINKFVSDSPIRKTAFQSVEQFEIQNSGNSKVYATVPLSDRNYPLRLKYRTATDTVRVGRIMEDLDTIAGLTSYEHNRRLETVLKLQIITFVHFLNVSFLFYNIFKDIIHV
jgi:hypothetical protein